MTESARPRALVTAPFRGEGLETLERLADVVLDPWIEANPLRIYDAEKLAARTLECDANIIVCEADRCAGPVLDLPLLAIGSTRGDPTNVDLEAATERGIPVLHAPGRNADAVAELTIALLFAATRHIVEADSDVRAGEVYRDGRIPYQRFRAWQLAGKTAGLVGLGAVGRATRWRLEGLGMRVIAYDPYSDEARHTLEALLEESDVVSMHAAVTPETSRMIGRAELAMLKPGAVYINSARARLHDIDALAEALASGQLGAVGLDHFEGERIAADHPILGLRNTVLTPHIGGATYDTEVNHSKLIADDLVRLLAGERPHYIANPAVLERS